MRFVIPGMDKLALGLGLWVNWRVTARMGYGFICIVTFQIYL